MVASPSCRIVDFDVTSKLLVTRKYKIMASELPQTGHTYVSNTDATLIVYVVDVIVAENVNEDLGTPFIVEGCDPMYKDDVENADGFELTAEIWKKHDFKLDE